MFVYTNLANKAVCVCVCVCIERFQAADRSSAVRRSSDQTDDLMDHQGLQYWTTRDVALRVHGGFR